MWVLRKNGRAVEVGDAVAMAQGLVSNVARPRFNPVTGGREGEDTQGNRFELVELPDVVECESP